MLHFLFYLILNCIPDLATLVSQVQINATIMSVAVFAFILHQLRLGHR